MFVKEIFERKIATIIVLGLDLDLLSHLWSLSRTLTLSPPRLMEHEDAPIVSLKPATVVVSF